MPIEWWELEWELEHKHSHWSRAVNGPEDIIICRCTHPDGGTSATSSSPPHVPMGWVKIYERAKHDGLNPLIFEGETLEVMCWLHEYQLTRGVT